MGIIVGRLQWDGRASVLGPLPTPASLDTRTGRHSDHRAAGSQHPAASSPGPLSARPALPSPPGWLRVWSRWNQRALPSFVCWCFLPFTACFLFSGLSGPGESWGQPGSQPSTPWETASREHSRRLRLWGQQLSHPLPPPDPSSSHLVDRTSPSMQEATQCPWIPKPPFQRLEASGVLRIH